MAMYMDPELMTSAPVITEGNEEKYDPENAPVEVMGLGTPVFPAVHLTAIITCGISTFVSGAILLYMFRTMKTSFWKCTMGDRLVVYLSICDLGFSISHGLDHVIIFGTDDNTPEPACSVIAWFVQEFTLGQSLVVNIAAVAAVIIIVRERRVSFGRYDWVLITWAFGFPAVLGVVIAGNDLLGAIGAWCFMDMRKAAGQALNTFYILAMITVFVVNSVCYIIVFAKIRQVEKMMESFSTGDTEAKEQSKRSRRSAQNMALLVLAFLFQWSLYVAYTSWSFFGNPSYKLLVADVFICNLGGVFNGIAYTLMRKYNRKAEGGGKKGKKGKGEDSLATSVTNVSEPTDKN
ncbi:hypothetical protein CAPTEDRAFT_194428 [Capitella teleta]|uniref:G-protein coupled receptors family 2 profile 2 domain-containing protein n=1 Tax=Capitella teleta TaxID=283909 RepID=R7U3D9_CAPTE|nr:hypothetical protein CAPTEDRAFT_194428 [Capitella teleta]|eukprot:ELU00855.1 hypothetical protein CAPTEDRAFT_194428 [Capitella teleta]